MKFWKYGLLGLVAFVGCTHSAPLTPVAPVTWRWMSIGATKDQAVYLDTTRITRRTDGYFDAWTRWEYLNQRSLGDDKYRVSVDHEVIDCDHRQMAFTESVYYIDPDFHAKSFPGRNQWQSVIPDSWGEGILTGVCAQQAHARAQ